MDYIAFHILGQGWPPVVTGYELTGFGHAKVSRVWTIMQFLHEMSPEVKGIRDHDFPIVKI
jgi:hypothetical protein